MTANTLSPLNAAFIDAINGGTLQEVDRALERGADIASKKFGQPALTLAASAGRARIVQRLIRAGADVNVFDGSLATAFHAAVYHKHFVVADMLLEAGANINAQGNPGFSATPLHGAIYQDMKEDSLERTRYLLTRGADTSIHAYIGIGKLEHQGDAQAQALSMPDNKGARLAALIASWDSMPMRLRRITARARQDGTRFRL